MFRNCLAAALRSLGRNRLHAGISIFGLAFGISAALIASLILRAETTFDAFVPARERTYLPVMRMDFPGQVLRIQTNSHHDLAALLKANLPQIEAISRVAPARGEVRHGEVHARESFYWADANIFDLIPLRALAGDPGSALSRPDGLVLTPEMSRK